MGAEPHETNTDDAILGGVIEKGTAWHHTSAEGLIHIIAEGRIRASSPLAMNDASELRHGETILSQVRDEFVGEGAFAAAVLTQKIRPLAEASCFLLCATSIRDSLNQWQHYSKAQGYAIEFDCEARLVPVGTQAPSGQNSPEKIGLFNGWYEVLYDERHQLERMRRVLSSLSTIENFPMMDWTGKVRFMQGLIATVMAQCKHPAFIGEREVRFIASSAYAEDVEKFRVGPRGIVPYVDLAVSEDEEQRLVTNAPMAHLPIRSVMCGPAPDSEPTAVAVRRLLNAHGYGSVEVTDSDVPYRF